MDDMHLSNNSLLIYKHFAKTIIPYHVIFS